MLNFTESIRRYFITSGKPIVSYLSNKFERRADLPPYHECEDIAHKNEKVDRIDILRTLNYCVDISFEPLEKVGLRGIICTTADGALISLHLLLG